jgi:sugar lactone lactonase YvrE
MHDRLKQLFLSFFVLFVSLLVTSCPSPAANTTVSQVSTPTFSPAGNTYSGDQSVTISCATSGATIHYTTDGSAPSGTSATYSAPISVAGNGTNETIKAIAAVSGMTDSDAASATYIINYGQVSTPTFSPAGNTYSGDQSVTISCATSGATIHYTTDGTTPTGASAVYTTMISVAGNGANETIKAIASKTGMADSPVASATYIISYGVVSTPTFNPAAGTYSSDQSVTISCATSGTTVYYTTDGSTPTTSSTLYSAAIPVAGNGTSETINAIATKDGMVDSAMASATYSIKYQVAAPTFSPGGGFYTSDQTVTITCATSGATIYYSFSPTPSTLYTAPISVGGSGTYRVLYAMATKSGMTDSTVASATYQVMYPKVATPVISPASGTYATDQVVSISCSTSGATIYYTTNNATPTTSSAVYTAPIGVAGNGVSVTVRAMAAQSGMTDSSVAVATYSIYDTWQTIGAQGGGTNQFRNPRAAIVDAGGHIYVSHMSNNRIVRFDDMSGTNWTTFAATFGSGTNQLEYPAGIALDGSGRIYIADPQNNRIVRMDDLSGTNWTTLTGSGADQYNYPTGILVDAAGHILVTDRGNRIVRVDDMAGTNWTTLGSTGSGIRQFNTPSGIALDGSGRIYVTDAGNNRIVRSDDMNGTNWTTFGSSGNGINQFNSPFGISVDASGHIFVADTGNIRIVRTNDMSGASWTTFGSTGSGINQFANPTSAFVGSDGYLYVADTQDYRVVRFVLP